MLWLFAYGFFVPPAAFALVTLLGAIRQPRAREIARLLLREGEEHNEEEEDAAPAPLLDPQTEAVLWLFFTIVAWLRDVKRSLTPVLRKALAVAIACLRQQILPPMRNLLMAIINAAPLIPPLLAQFYHDVVALVDQWLKARADADAEKVKLRRIEMSRRNSEAEIRALVKAEYGYPCPHGEIPPKCQLALREYQEECRKEFESQVEREVEVRVKSRVDALWKHFTTEMKLMSDQGENATKREAYLRKEWEREKIDNSKLRSEIQGLREQKRLLQTEFSLKGQEGLVQQLTEVTTKIKVLQAELDRRNQELSELRRAVDPGHQAQATNEQLVEAQAEIQRLQALLATEMAEHEQARQADRAVYDSWFSQNLVLYNQVVEERDQLATQLSEEKKVSEQRQTTLSQTEAKLPGKERELEQCKLDRDQFARAIKAVQERNVYLESKTIELEKSKGGLEKQIQSLNESLRRVDYGSEIARFCEEIADRDATIRELKKKVEVYREVRNSASSKLKCLEQAQEKSRQSSSGGNVDHAQCEQDVAFWKMAFESDKEDYEARIEKLEADFKACDEVLQIARRDAKYHEDQSTLLRGRLEEQAVRSKSKQLQAEKVRLEKDLRITRENYNDVKEQLEIARAMLMSKETDATTELRLVAEGLEDRLRLCHDRATDMRRHIDDARDEYEQLREMWSDMDSRPGFSAAMAHNSIENYLARAGENLKVMIQTTRK